MYGTCLNIKNRNHQQCIAVWTDWLEAACPVSCGGGTTTRTRTCKDGNVDLVPAACGGEDTMTVTCNDNNCPCKAVQDLSCSITHCNIFFPVWSDWSDSDCPVTCGASSYPSSRTCLSKPGRNVIDSSYCSGDDTRTVECEEDECPGEPEIYSRTATTL